MARSLPRWVLPALGAVAIVVSIGLWRYFGSPNVDRSASRFAQVFQRGDWGALYDMASNEERQMQTFSRAQFVQLMSAIADRRFGSVRSVTFSGDWQRQTTSKFFTLKVENERGEVVPIYLHFYRDYDDWHPEVMRIPLLIYSRTNPATREDAQFLHDACVKAGVRTILRPLDRLEFSNDRLGLYLEGKLSWSAVSRPRSLY